MTDIARGSLAEIHYPLITTHGDRVSIVSGVFTPAECEALIASTTFSPGAGCVNTGAFGMFNAVEDVAD